MRNLILFFCFFLSTNALFAQQTIDPNLPEFSFNEAELAGEMHWLASDYLQGRRTGSVGNEIAAEYIAAQLRGFGYRPLNDGSFFQTVALQTTIAPAAAQLTIGENTYRQGGDLLIIRGDALPEQDAKVVFAGYGWVDESMDHDDYDKLKVKGKIVIARPGIPGDQSQGAIFTNVNRKLELARERGAIALIEVFTLPYPWQAFQNYLGGERMGLAPTNDQPQIPYGYVKAAEEVMGALAGKKKGVAGSFSTAGLVRTPLNSRNVGGILEGTDPDLKGEYMLMTAHFDHVGVGAQGGGPFTPEDSIFNGARDNVIGTISLLSAARAFAEVPPRRSVIILAVTGEEMGLLGSEYFARNPLVSLDEIVFNFNTDGAGYNDTSAVSLIGSDRTGIDPQVDAAATAFGLKVIKDPAPEQGLYDRSDNVSFSKKGVPSLSLSPGMTDFDEEMMRYYHQVTDNPETIDMAYLKKYCQVYTLAARLIANRNERPTWKEGDKYFQAGQELYGK